MKRILVVTMIVAVVAAQPSHSQVPSTMSYQGVLTDGAGEPVADGTYDITFKLYDTASGGSALWTETQSVPVGGGIFSVILGKSTPLTVSFDKPYWLGVSVEGGPEFTPRRELTATPYSLNAKAVQAGAVTESALADSSVTGPKIGRGTAVRSLNSLTDDVTLRAGPNVSITSSGDTLTIGATGVGGGDVTAVIAGDGLAGGGSSGDVLLNIGAGSGISVFADSIALDSAFADARYVEEGETGAITGGMIQPGAVGEGALADSSVGSGKIAGATVVRSLNSLSDDVVLAAGANVTITSSGDTLTVASTGAGADADWTILGNDMYSSVTGNVGIGTASPTAKVDVVGDVNTDTDYKIDGYTALSVEGTSNILVGTFAGQNNTGNNVTLIGSYAGRNNEADYNTFISSMSGYDNTTGQSNTFIGYHAGRYNTVGSTNTFVGREAGRDNTTGGGNTFVGFDAGLNNTTAYSNTFIGKDAGVANETGASNTFVGRGSGPFNDVGRDNVFLGTYSGYRNTGGRENVFLGSGTGYENLTGNFNTFLGRWAGRFNQAGEGNVFIGYNAGSNETGSNRLYIANTNTSTPLVYGEFDSGLLGINGNLDASGSINTDTGYDFAGNRVLSASGTENITVGVGAGANNTGSYGTFVGRNAGYNNQGNSNTFLGRYAGYSNSTGGSNTFVGLQAGRSNSTGASNTFLGLQAGDLNISGNQNTFVGTQAGASNSSGIGNVFLGFQAGYDNDDGDFNTLLGYGAGTNNTSGYANTFVGRSAGAYNTTGAHNVFIGYEAGFSETGNNKLYIANSRNDVNVLIYGDFAVGRVGIGTLSPGYTLDVAGPAHATSFPTSSDARLKENVVQLDNVLDKLEQIRGVSFDWNAVYESLGRSTGHREIGVIAQEVEAQFPELVTEWGEEHYKAVDYGRLTGVLIEAIKELRAENRALRKRLDSLEKGTD